ncbi:MAG: hypothetical protein ACO3A2_06245 [Bdellovibrionia bacterium]
MLDRSSHRVENQNPVQWQASVHDQSQFEIVIDYQVPQVRSEQGSGRREQKSEMSYWVDFYFFTPKNLGLNSQVYPRESFYQDLTNLVRIHTPKKDLIHAAILPTLENLLVLDQSQPFFPEQTHRAIQEVKIFANYVNLRLKTWFNHKPALSDDQWVIQGSEIIELVEHFRMRYLKPSLQSIALDSDLASALLWVDEYLSNRLEVSFSKISLSQVSSPRSSFARRFLSNEYQHRAERGYVTPGRAATDRNLEQFYHRHGMLKKFVSESLYLKTQEVKRDRLYRNMMAGFGAALAGVWAEVAKMDSQLARGARDFGVRFMVLASVGVLIYVFKDRIKEISKEYFNEKLKGFLPDYEVLLTYPFFDRLGKKQDLRVGKYQETVRYLSSESLPEDIRFVRDLTQAEDLFGENQENIIHYSKRVALNPTVSSQMETELLSLKDIFRFNMGGFLQYLDNPEKSLAIYDFEEGAIQIRAPKVYYFNLFLRMSAWDQGLDQPRKKTTQIEHLRLVLNKSGIVRLDAVFPRGEHWYEDEAE